MSFKDEFQEANLAKQREAFYALSDAMKNIDEIIY